MPNSAAGISVAGASAAAWPPHRSTTPGYFDPASIPAAPAEQRSRPTVPFSQFGKAMGAAAIGARHDDRWVATSLDEKNGLELRRAVPGLPNEVRRVPLAEAMASHPMPIELRHLLFEGPDGVVSDGWQWHGRPSDGLVRKDGVVLPADLEGAAHRTLRNRDLRTGILHWDSMDRLVRLTDARFIVKDDLVRDAVYTEQTARGALRHSLDTLRRAGEHHAARFPTLDRQILKGPLKVQINMLTDIGNASFDGGGIRFGPVDAEAGERLVAKFGERHRARVDAALAASMVFHREPGVAMHELVHQKLAALMDTESFPQSLKEGRRAVEQRSVHEAWADTLQAAYRQNWRLGGETSMAIRDIGLGVSHDGTPLARTMRDVDEIFKAMPRGGGVVPTGDAHLASGVISQAARQMQAEPDIGWRGIEELFYRSMFTMRDAGSQVPDLRGAAAALRTTAQSMWGTASPKNVAVVKAALTAARL